MARRGEIGRRSFSLKRYLGRGNGTCVPVSPPTESARLIVNLGLCGERGQAGADRVLDVCQAR